MRNGSYSNQLPEYLALDLKVGTSAQHPLIGALNDIVAGLSSLAHRNALSLDPSAFNQTQKRFTLEEMGFCVDHLAPNALDRFYHQLHVILHLKPSLRAVECLAEIYFGPCAVRRGMPYPRHFLNASLRLPFALAAGEDTNKVIFVETQDNTVSTQHGNLIDEFISNARLLLPEHYTVCVAPRAEKRAKVPSGIRLAGNIPVHERRL